MGTLSTRLAILTVSGAALLATTGVPVPPDPRPNYVRRKPAIRLRSQEPPRDPLPVEMGAAVDAPDAPSVVAPLPFCPSEQTEPPGRPAEELWAELRGRDRAMAASALRELARQRAPGFERAVANALTSPRWELREAALGVSREIPLPTLAGTFAALTDHPCASTQLAACAALVLLGDDRALPRLESVLSEADGLLRFEAARILTGRFPARGAEEADAAYRDLEAGLRRVAISRLLSACPSGLATFLEPLAESAEPWEREGALAALARLRNRR